MQKSESVRVFGGQSESVGGQKVPEIELWGYLNTVYHWSIEINKRQGSPELISNFCTFIHPKKVPISCLKVSGWGWGYCEKIEFEIENDSEIKLNRTLVIKAIILKLLQTHILNCLYHIIINIIIRIIRSTRCIQNIQLYLHQ